MPVASLPVCYLAKPDMGLPLEDIGFTFWEMAPGPALDAGRKKEVPGRGA